MASHFTRLSVRLAVHASKVVKKGSGEYKLVFIYEKQTRRSPPTKGGVGYLSKELECVCSYVRIFDAEH